MTWFVGSTQKGDSKDIEDIKKRIDKLEIMMNEFMKGDFESMQRAPSIVSFLKDLQKKLKG